MNKKVLCLWIVGMFLLSLGAVPAFQESYVSAAEIKAIVADASEFPDYVKITLSFDARYKLTMSDFEVYEDGKSQPISKVTHPSEASILPADIVIVFDDTGSMGDEIGTWKHNVVNFVENVKRKGIDARWSLVTFKDNVEVDLTWTTDTDTLIRAVDGLYASGGGDGPEDSLDGIMKAIELMKRARPNAQRIIIVITDAPSHYRGDGTYFSAYTLPEVEKALKESGITLISVSPDFSKGINVKTLADDIGGIWIDMYGGDFTEVIDKVSQSIYSKYEIFYKPTNQKRDGTKRHVLVKVYLSDGTVLEKETTYTAPTEEKKRYEVTPDEQAVYETLKKIDEWFKDSEGMLSTLDLSCVNLKEAAGFSAGTGFGGGGAGARGSSFVPPNPDTESCLFEKFVKANEDLPLLEVSKKEMNKLRRYLLSKRRAFSLGSFKLEPVTVGFMRGYKVSDDKGSYFYIGLNITTIVTKVIPPDLHIPLPTETISFDEFEMDIWRPVSMEVGYAIPKIVFTHYAAQPLAQPLERPGVPVVFDNLATRTDFMLSQRFGGKLFTLKPVTFEDGSVYISLSGDGSLKAKIFGTGYEASGGIEYTIKIFPKLECELSSKWNTEMSVGTPLTGYVITEVQKSAGIEWRPLVYAKNPSNYLPVPPPDLGTAKIFGSWIMISGEWIGLPDDWMDAGLAFIYSMLTKDERENTYLFKETEIAAGYKHGVRFKFKKIVSSENNFYPRGSRNYKYKYVYYSGLNPSVGISVSVGVPGLSVNIPELLELGLFADLGGSIGFSIPVRGYEIVDPTIKDSNLQFESRFIQDMPIDTNSNGLFNFLALSFNVTTDSPGEYNLIPTLLINGSLATAQGFDVALHKGANIVTLNISGQYIYYTNHTGPFEVGLIIQDKNGTLVYYNFSLGKTKSYDYRQFEHVVPEFDFKYVPLDVDGDGKYDEVQINVTEVHGWKGFTVTPMLTGNGWIIYLNTTNMTSPTYTITIDGMHVRKLMGNFTFLMHVTNITNGIYLGSYRWRISENPLKFESEYPTIEKAIPISFNYKPAVMFTINVPKESNITISTKYEVGDTTYSAGGYFGNVTPGIHNLTVFLDESPFVMHNTRNATILSATLVSNGLTTDSVMINKEASFFLLPRGRIWNITSNINVTSKIVNITTDVLSYENTNATVIITFTSGNVSLVKFTYPELEKQTILEIPVSFNLRGMTSDLSKEANVSVIVYNQKGTLVDIKTIQINISSLVPNPPVKTKESRGVVSVITLSQLWTWFFFHYYDEFNKLYANATTLGIDNETLQRALELHNNAVKLIKQAWRVNSLDDIKAKLWGGIKIVPLPGYARKAYLEERKAVTLLKGH